MQMTSNQSKRHRKGKTIDAKSKENSTNATNADNTERSDSKSHDLDDESNSGFAGYLKSSQGIEMMRLFVIANSLVVFMTIAWPSIKDTIEILSDYINGENLQDIYDHQLKMIVAVRYFLFIGIMFWYSSGIWNLINGYFQQQFKAILDEEMKVNNRKLSTNTIHTSSSHSSTVVNTVTAETGNIAMNSDGNPFYRCETNDEKVSISGLIKKMSTNHMTTQDADNEEIRENIKGRNFRQSQLQRSLTHLNNDITGNTCVIEIKSLHITC